MGLWAAEWNWEDSVEVKTEATGSMAAGMGLAAVEEAEEGM